MMPVPGLVHRMVDRQLAELLPPLARAAGLISDAQFNLGDQDDYRVPDRGLMRPADLADWQETAALVVEILSPGDETPQKLPFYAKHGVDEIVIVDPRERTVEWLALEQGEYRPISRSALIDLGPKELAQQLDWLEIRD
jgi:Uma2 family endonuclease